MASKQESDMENEQNYTVEYVGNQYVYNTNYWLSECTKAELLQEGFFTHSRRNWEISIIQKLEIELGKTTMYIISVS